MATTKTRNPHSARCQSVPNFPRLRALALSIETWAERGATYQKAWAIGVTLGGSKEEKNEVTRTFYLPYMIGHTGELW
jgi:hypothetical protein